jgi:hypothetical protein
MSVNLAVKQKLLKEERIIIDDLDSFYQRIRQINFRVKREILDAIAF